MQAGHALLEAADFAIDEKARKDGGAAHYIQDELRALHTARHAVSLVGAEATRSATLELSAAFGNYFQAIEDRPETERDEARLAVVDLERIVQARAPSRSQKAALRSRIRPLPIFARSRGHCSDQAMKRFVQD